GLEPVCPPPPTTRSPCCPEGGFLLAPAPGGAFSGAFPPISGQWFPKFQSWNFPEVELESEEDAARPSATGPGGHTKRAEPLRPLGVRWSGHHNRLNEPFP